ncbi:MAG: DEAD/DEAH box helicase family protein [Phycisphaerae bacterium]
MAIKTLKAFQSAAIDSAMAVFGYAKEMLDAAGGDAAGRAAAIHDNGYLLIEAPTGSGKTLMAGHIVERMSALDQVVWFWFAPFKGVVDQTAAALREQFAGLRLRTLAEDRAPEGTRAGDVFVTTWQLVATRVKDRRSVRKTGETNPSVDEMAAALRAQGLRIGVVVDEAHHGFHGETQAADFFRGVLAPEYTILVTATPDDADLADLERRMQAGRVQRISVSRADAVSAGLIKDGIKCVSWQAEPGSAALIDFEATALREGAALHQLLKAELARAGVSLVPLMLVQVDSTDRSVERARERLLALGFREAQIAVHTADEPDAGLLALANDETREVLVFKMAVALGFDAPRAWTLVSMRAARDADFGVQLVGRILRVHRRLQGRAVPEALKFGYVLLADAEAQTGIDAAGQRINALHTEYARLTRTTVVVRVGNLDTVQVLGADGQASFWPVPPEGAIWTPPPAEAVPSPAAGLFPPAVATAPGVAPPWIIAVPGGRAPRFSYPLRSDVPRRFKTQDLPEEFDVTEEDCAARFVLSAETLLDVLLKHDKVKVSKRTIEIFTQAIQMELAFALPSPEQMRHLAQRALLRGGVFDPKALRAALLTRLHTVLIEKGVEDSDDPNTLNEYLDVLLATHGELLSEAQRAALVRAAVIQEAEPLPAELAAEAPLPPSARNVYRAVPPDLNSWEREFGELLDRDTTGTVLWWHRNPVSKPWSVRVLLVDGRGFFPDFLVGIRERKTEDGGLLADTKFAYDTNQEMPKILAEHASYGRVLILSKNQSHQWAIARIEDGSGRPLLGRTFSLSDAAAY